MDAAYDYHGPWDTNITGVNPAARPQSSLVNITDSALLYTRAGINLDKVNLGLAMYGRTYKLADPNCKGYDCAMTAGGSPGACTDAAGVLSEWEVVDLLKTKGLKGTKDEKSQTLFVNFDGQLLTYDDDSTRKWVHPLVVFF